MFSFMYETMSDFAKWYKITQELNVNTPNAIYKPKRSQVLKNKKKKHKRKGKRK